MVQHKTIDAKIIPISIGIFSTILNEILNEIPFLYCENVQDVFEFIDLTASWRKSSKK